MSANQRAEMKEHNIIVTFCAKITYAYNHV